MEEGQGWGFTGGGENLAGIQEVNPVLQGFAAVLQCLHLDKGALKQQDTKGLKITVCVRLGQVTDSKIQVKIGKTQLPLLKTQEQKQGPACPPALHTSKGCADHLNHPSSQPPGHTPARIPCREPALSPSGASKGTVSYSPSLWLQRWPP